MASPLVLVPDLQWETQLTSFAKGNNLEGIQALLAAGANPNSGISRSIRVPVSIVKCDVCFLSGVYGVIDFPSYSNSPLLSCYESHPLTLFVAVMTIIQNGHNSLNGLRALHWAAYFGHTAIVKALVAAGADRTACVSAINVCMLSHLSMQVVKERKSSLCIVWMCFSSFPCRVLLKTTTPSAPRLQ